MTKISLILSLALLTLVAAPTLVSAQPQNAPVRVAAVGEPMPDAQELLDNIFAPYAAAKTFSGTFDLTFEGDTSKIGIKELRLKTRYRFNVKGDLQSEDLTINFTSSDVAGETSSLRFIHDSIVNIGYSPDSKVWWKEGKDELGAEPQMTALLKPIFDAIIQGFAENKLKPLVSRSVEAGRPVYVLKMKGSNDFRIVIDQQSRAVRAFYIKDGFSIRGTNQTFNEPMTDESFNWTAPDGFSEIDQDEIEDKIPEFLKGLLNKPEAATAATPKE